ncbi:vitellogenin receptor [Fopius arisanus]|uniref:Vitellogenin receptor n=4 Tax=Fopius arisanus TaxID=64838 RepID=A0A9R1ST96_9HYME|nr:PREDICTED: vitellogenin receptor-like [Fopius arisanus]
MYWSDWGSVPHISTSGMNGNSRSTLVTDNLGWPNGLTIDYPHARLYWVDAKLKIVQSLKLDGSDRRTVHHTALTHPFSIAILDEKLFWSDLRRKSIHHCNKLTGRDEKTLLKESNEIYGIHIHHPVLKPKLYNPCSSASCEEICLLAADRNHYTCACGLDEELGFDGKSCIRIKNVNQHIIIATGKVFLDYRHDILGRPHWERIHTSHHFAEIYESLNRNSLSNSNQIMFDEISRVFGADEIIGGTGFDHVGNNLYSADVENRRIEVMSLSTLEKTFILFSEEPRAILLIPEKSTMFVALCVSSSCHIDKMLMTGGERSRFLKNNFRGPRVALAYDAETDRVFLTDEGTGRIESVSFDGNERKLLHLHLPQPVSLAILGDEVFWTLKNTTTVFWSNKTKSFTGRKRFDLPIPSVDVMHLITTSSKNYSIDNVHQCQINNGGCSHVCLVESLTSRACRCPPAMILDADHETCLLDSACPKEEFECSYDHSCISLSLRCDGVDDCFNGADEVNCTSCGDGEFSCDNFNCISTALVCDNRDDCGDNSDEKSCLDEIPMTISKSKPVVEKTGNIDLLTDAREDIRRICSEAQGRQATRSEGEASGLTNWSPKLLKIIHEMNLKTREKEDNGNSGLPRVLAVDWITHNVFYLDGETPGEVRSCSFNETKATLVVQAKNPGVVSSFVVEPRVGWFFWGQTNFSAQNPTTEIWRSDLDGENLVNIAGNLGVVSGIAIDHERSRLYWVDTSLQVIERAKLDGSARDVFLRTKLQYPVTINVYGDSLYWLMGTSGVLQKCSLLEDVCVPVTVRNHYGQELLVVSQPSRKIMTPPVFSYFIQYGLENLTIAAKNGYKTGGNSIGDQVIPTVVPLICVFTEAQSEKLGGIDEGNHSTDIQHPVIQEEVSFLVLESPSFLPLSAMARIHLLFTSVLLCLHYQAISSDTCESPDWFRCNNGRCLASFFRCDGDNDCGDFSDERSCPETPNSPSTPQPNRCTPQEFTCTNGNCIPLSKFCNNENNCYDGSDEYAGCVLNKTCNAREFGCADGYCIQEKWRCDGQADCPDHSDEFNCPVHPPENCTVDNGFFLCDNNHCIPLNLTCSSFNDCGDNSDEHSAICTAAEQKCKTMNCSHSCQPTPKGPSCTCSPGYRMVNDSCQDIDECMESPELCDHHCINEPGTYSCLCDMSYDLQEDRHTCKVSKDRGDAILIFSSRTEIRGFYLSTHEVYFPIAKNLQHVIGVALDSMYIYWSDIHMGDEAIFRALEDGIKPEVIVTAGLGIPEEISVDWVTGNIYFTDSLYRRIGVCTNSGSHCAVIITEDIDRPRGLVLHPATGEMYWSDWGERPHISRAEMNGHSRAPIVTEGLGWPNGLTIDYPNSRLYWVDAKVDIIESIHLDGTGRRTVLRTIATHPFSIAVFEDRLFWSDWKTKSIQYCNKFTGKGEKTLLHEVDEIYGIHIYHSVLKPDLHNPCNANPCEGICLLNAQHNYTCTCSPDKTLGEDGESCERIKDANHLIIAAGGLFIDYYHQILGKPEMEGHQTLHHFDAAAYDPIQEGILVVDQKSQTINRFTPSSGVYVRLLGITQEVIQGLAFDYFGNNMYWSDVDHKTIVITSLSTWNRTLFHFLEKPTSILLIPELATMYVAFCSVVKCHIDRMSMTGSRRIQIMDHLLGPRVTLAFDHETRRIFWADQGSGIIGCMSLDGTNKKFLHTNLVEPVSVAILDDEIFWTLKNNTRIFWSSSSKILTRNKGLTLEIPADVDMMHLVTTSLRSGRSDHMCRENNGGCSHLCLVDTPETGICKCPPGMILASNKKTCVVETTCSEVEFKCSDNSCIDNTKLCNGIDDCHDGEDEKHCISSKACTVDEFQCRDSSKCIPSYKICDGIAQCFDSSDEVNCAARTCDSFSFRCPSGLCIPGSWECDGQKDCDDGADESSKCTRKTCPKAMFTCQNQKCIDAKLICNAVDDCEDSSDEMNCRRESSVARSCGTNKYTCIGSGQCIPMNKRCDGEMDCPKNDDEHHCSHCSGDEFACSNLKCIPKFWMCDDQDDCGDNSDEKGCDVHKHWGSSVQKDETPCPEFKCNVSGRCLRWEYVCDGLNDCFDSSDEGDGCATSCSSENTCEHVCQRTPTGPLCWCREGFTLDTDGRSCQDVDECKNNVCSQVCHNIVGSYECSCFPGYVLRLDRTTCKVVNSSMELITATRDDIRRIPVNLEVIEVVHRQPEIQITGLDVNVGKESIYWSSELLGSIHEFNFRSTEHHRIANIGRPRALAVDWMTDNVYFFDTEKPEAIKACNVNQTKCAVIVKLENPGTVLSLAVDPKNGFVFWGQTTFVDLDKPTSEIWRSDLNGDNPRNIVSDDLGVVSGITIDHERGTIYWVDAALHVVERANLEGKEREVFMRDQVYQPVGINVFEDAVFWLIGTSGIMQKCLLNGERRCQQVPVKSNNVEGLFVISHQSRQPVGINACESHSCDYMCIQRQGIPRCICHDGSEQDPDSACPYSDIPDIRFDSYSLLMRKNEGLAKTEREAGPLTGIIVMVVLGIAMLSGYWYYQKHKTEISNKYDLRIRFQNPSFGTDPGITSDYILPIIPPGEHEYENPLSIHTKAHVPSIPKTNSKQSLELINSDQSDVELINDDTGYKTRLIKP